MYYINSVLFFQDRVGDTNLIHAVKGGHRGVVEPLLKKYAEVNTPGKVIIIFFHVIIFHIFLVIFH